MKIHSLQGRIIIFIVPLLVVLQGIAYFAIDTAIMRNAETTVADELSVGQRVFTHLMERKLEQLAQSAAVLSADYGFREAVATQDRPTMILALQNHGKRINADFMVVANLQGTVLADTLQPSLADRPFPYPQLVSGAEHKGFAAAVMQMGGQAYEVLVVPVAAPLTVAWVAIGFGVNDKLAADVSALTGLEVSFVTRVANDERTLLATTLAKQQQDVLLHQFGGDTTAFAAAGYRSVVVPLWKEGDSEVSAVLQRSVVEALLPFDRVRQTLLALTLLGIGLSVIGSILTARTISRPMRELAEGAKRIGRGDYGHRLGVRHEDELGELSSAMNHMREGIAIREREILRLVDLAYQDDLTGLPNRAMFDDRLRQIISVCQRNDTPLTVMMVDLDRFKQVNDTLGHHIGDKLLREVGRRLRTAAMRKTDTVARLSGDEFAVLLPGANAEAAQSVARRLLDAMSQPIAIEGHILKVNGSIGIATYPEHGDDVAQLMRAADTAMYAAKRQRTGFALHAELKPAAAAL